MAKSKLAIIEDRVFEDVFPVYLSEVEYESIRPKITMDVDESDVFMNGGFDPLSGATITVDTAGRKHIEEILCGRPREREDPLSSHITFNTAYQRYVTPNEVVELYSAFDKVEFGNVDDLVAVYELITKWLTEVENHRYVSIGYSGLSSADMQKVTTFIKAIEKQAHNINIRNLGKHNTMDGAWANIERMLFRNNLDIHDPMYLSNTLSHEFRMTDRRPKVLTKGRLVVPGRVTTEVTDVSSYQEPNVKPKE